MISPLLYTDRTEEMGYGVFTRGNIEEGTIVETSPVIVMSAGERKLLDQTRLHDYIFEWGEKRDQCCMAMGLVPIYNHSYKSNCEYEMDFDKNEISIRTVRFVKEGEELFINYDHL